VATPEQAPQSPASRGRGRHSFTGHVGTTVLLLLCAFGAWLRLDDLLHQTPFHDEWHPLLAVMWWNAERIASAFGHADHSIPITLYLEALSRIDLLGPLLFWGPFAFIRLIVIPGLPALFSRHFGGAPAWLF